jgi:hypothetical protein
LHLPAHTEREERKKTATLFIRMMRSAVLKYLKEPLSVFPQTTLVQGEARQFTRPQRQRSPLHFSVHLFCTEARTVLYCSSNYFLPSLSFIETACRLHICARDVFLQRVQIKRRLSICPSSVAGDKGCIVGVHFILTTVRVAFRSINVKYYLHRWGAEKHCRRDVHKKALRAKVISCCILVAICKKTI